MKKYLLLYFSLFFCMSPLAEAMDDDQDENEYDQSEDENDSSSMQNNMMYQNNAMMQQPNMMYQNNAMMQQPNMMYQNNAMMRQPNMMYQNNAMMQQPNGMRNRRNQEDYETSKTEYVRSLVDGILRVNHNRQDVSSAITKNERAVVDRDLKNKLLKLQKHVDELSQGLDENSQTDEADSVNEQSSKKSKTLKKAQKTQSSKKEKSLKKSRLSKRKKSSKRFKSSKLGRYHKKNPSKKISKFNRQRSFYTVKQLTPRNAIKYVPQYYSSQYNNSDYYQNFSPVKATTYQVKNWGTGEITSAEFYYLNSSQKPYFSDKSKCVSGCGGTSNLNVQVNE